MKYKITFELRTGASGDISDVLDGITRLLDQNFPSGEFYGGADVDEDSIEVEEAKQ